VGRNSLNFVQTAKYTDRSFIPQNLWEQFLDPVKLYLLGVTALLPFVSDMEPFTSILPLLILMSNSAYRDFFRDKGLRAQDKKTNFEMIQVLSPAGLTSIRCQDLCPGDIVKVLDGRTIPADLVLLQTSRTSGSCTVQTFDLDGELDLQRRGALGLTKSYTVGQLQNLEAILRVGKPNPDLSNFQGVFEAHGNAEPELIGLDALVLRGAVLQETDFIYGVVAYTGHATKLCLNLVHHPVKQSQNQAWFTTYAKAAVACQLAICFLLPPVQPSRHPKRYHAPVMAGAFRESRKQIASWHATAALA